MANGIDETYARLMDELEEAVASGDASQAHRDRIKILRERIETLLREQMGQPSKPSGEAE